MTGRFSVLIAAVTLSLGCQSTTGSLQPALAEDWQSADIATVTSTLQSVLGHNRVKLTDTAFATSHILVLSPPASTPQQKIASSRTVEKPDTFHLLTDGRDCFIRSLRDDTLTPLPGIQCSALPESE